jgi:hypothetical protein
MEEDCIVVGLEGISVRNARVKVTSPQGKDLEKSYSPRF